MTRMKPLFVALVLALAMPFASAQVVHFVGVGSSSMFHGFEVATVNDLAPLVNPAFSIHHWSIKTDHVGGCAPKCAGGNDFRGGLTAWGNFWAVWVCQVKANPCPAGNLTDIWVYLSIDSVVGDRLFLAQPTAFLEAGTIAATPPDNVTTPALLDFGAPANGSAAACPAGFIANCDDAALDPAVIAALGGANGIAFTAALTDIRPEDAKYATSRALGVPVDTGVNSFALGYGPGPFGGQIFSWVSPTPPIAQPVSFGLPGYPDPINTQYTVPATIKVIAVGEAPLLFVANRSNVANGLGQPCNAVACAGAPWATSYWASNLWDQHPWSPNGMPPSAVPPPPGANTRRPLGNLFTGHDCGTDNAAFQPTDIGAKANPPAGAPQAVALFLREPLSGAMNTAEFTEFRRYGSEDGNGPTGDGLPAKTSQEQNVLPVGVNNNPLGLVCINSPAGGIRYRGIGTAEVVNGSRGNFGVLNQVDGLAYTFFSYGNVSKLAANPNYGYLMIDGIDPLFDNYNNSAGDAGQPAVNANGTTWGELPTCNQQTGLPVFCNAISVWTHVDPICGAAGCSFPHLRDGTYPAWSELRLLCDTANIHCLAPLPGGGGDPFGAEALVENLQWDIHNNNFGGVPDLLPFSEAAPPSALSFNYPFGDVGYVREHYNYQSSVGNLNAPPSSIHQSNPQVQFKCENFGGVVDVPIAGFPANECGGDAGGLIALAPAIAGVQSSVSVTAAAAPGVGGSQVFTYAAVAGPPLAVGESIMVTGMTKPTDNGIFVITALGAGTFTVVNAPGLAAALQSGAGVTGMASAGLNGTATLGAVVLAPHIQVTISKAVQAAGNTTFTYAGPALGLGQSITVYNMPNAGDNGTFYITALGAGTFTVANAAGVTNLATAGDGVTTTGSQQ